MVRLPPITSFETAGIPRVGVIRVSLQRFFKGACQSQPFQPDYTEWTNHITYIYVVIAMLGQRQRRGNERSYSINLIPRF